MTASALQLRRGLRPLTFRPGSKVARTPQASSGTDSSAAAGTTVRTALIVNPYSSGMTSKRERELVELFRAHVELDVLRTEHPGHGPELAAAAVADGVDVIIACGGDGTANEVVNGMGLAENQANESPVFALIPAGGTNVLCRSLGLPNHPIAAARVILDAVVSRRSQTINLGRFDERLFLFAAGIGFDGELVKRIDSRRRGRRPSDLAHVMTMAGMFAAERFAYGDRMTIRVDGDSDEQRACLLMCGNTSPMSYMGRIPLNFMPDCTLDGGLDFIAPKRQNVRQAILSGARAMGLGRIASKRSLELMGLRHDVDGFTVVCDEPQACQADGEYLGDRTNIRIENVRRCIRLAH